MNRRWTFFSVGLLSALVVLNVARAEFDGRLPASVAVPLDLSNPSLPSPPLPALAATSNFLRVHGGELLVYWDVLLDTPRLIAARNLATAPRIVSDLGAGADVETAVDSAAIIAAITTGVWQFVEANRRLLGVGPENLHGPEVRRLGDHWLVLLGQHARGIGVRGASLRLLVTDDGRLALLKAFVARDADTLVAGLEDIAGTTWDSASILASPGAEAELAQAAEREVWVVKGAPQIVFTSADLASARAEWRIVVEAENGPGEVLADLATGTIIEERRFIQELGIVDGHVRAYSATPDDRDPDFFYALPDDMAFHPVIGTMVTSSIDVGFTGDDGDFSLVMAGDTTEVRWSLRTGACRQSALVEGDLLPAVVGDRPRGADYCSLEGGKSLPDVVDFRVLMLAALDSCTRAVDLVEVLHGRVVGAADQPLFDLNPVDIRSVLLSARLQAFRHVSRFLGHAAERARALGLTVDHLPGLRVAILDVRENIRHYHASTLYPQICYSVNLRPETVPRVPGQPPNPEDLQDRGQPMTPTTLNHETAHHIIFETTRFRTGSKFDCHNQIDVRCIDAAADADLLDEAAVVEGITDALAAYYADTPKFGYVSEGEVAMRGAYDISTGDDPSVESETRRVMAKLLWEIREEFIDGVEGNNAIKVEKAAAEDLLYTWFAFSKCLDDSSHAFELGPCLLAEFIVLDDIVDNENRSAALRKVFSRYPGLSPTQFLRGDSNQDGLHDLADVIFTLGYLFLGGEAGDCLDAMDADDNGRLEITDAVSFLGFLFVGGEPPPFPFPDCGADLTHDGLRCARSGCKHPFDPEAVE